MAKQDHGKFFLKMPWRIPHSDTPYPPSHLYNFLATFRESKHQLGRLCMSMAENNENVQELNNNISETATTEAKKEIEPFSGVIDTDEVREKIESDPFIQQTVESFLKHAEFKRREEEHDKECAFVDSILRTPEFNNEEEHEHDHCGNQGSTIEDAKHTTKTP
ncbi:unnamed protein product [Sphenostylis stenocarpa]|uniref:Uncharacterized protein n=1 Tax=Sphenostylis stenocarpa TaxID=92480 RepID=A0AA86T163_9FABA|nr:unnamed protein product [Sphenostylis stenocarpa]